MKNNLIKLFSILVCISMMLSLISPAAFAAEYENDGIYVEINAPDDAAYCKAMLWNKNTLKPLCNAAGCEVVKEV